MSHTAHAGLLATPGPPLEHEGRLYRANPLDQNAKAEIERRLTAQAMHAASMAPPKMRGEAFAAVAADAAGGAYSFYGAASTRAMQSPSGILILASVLFRIEADEAVALIEAHPEEVKAILDLVVLESLSEAARARVLAERKAAAEPEKNGRVGASEEGSPTPV